MKLKKHKGIGDTLYFTFKALGIKAIVDWLYDGKECGCKSRRNKLNKKYPYTWKTS